MDSKTSGQTQENFIDFQAKTKYFFDVAQQCFDHCITEF